LIIWSFSLCGLCKLTGKLRIVSLRNDILQGCESQRDENFFEKTEDIPSGFRLKKQQLARIRRLIVFTKTTLPKREDFF